MNFNTYYFIWIFFVSIQTYCFVMFYLKHRKQQKKWDEEFKKQKETGLDMVEFLVYNDKAYWIEKNSVVRARYANRKVFLSTKEKVDPFKIKDVDISEYMGILSKLEQR